MSEKRFVESIQQSVKMLHPTAFVWKTNDRFTLGIPDLFIIIDGITYAIEAKSANLASTIQSFKRDPPEDVPMLKHPFSGTQISVMRQIIRAGGYAFGAVQVASDTLYLIHPDKIPKGGNLSFRFVDDNCPKVTKRENLWRVTEWPRLLCLSKKSKMNQKSSEPQK